MGDGGNGWRLTRQEIPLEERQEGSIRIYAKWLLGQLLVPALAVVTALVLGAIIIWASGSDPLVAYRGLLDGAFIKKRAFSESLVATTPYILLGLAVAFGFKCGLFNIGAEGQFYIGQLAAVWVGYNVHGLPTWLHLSLALGAGMLAGAIWSAIPGYLRAKLGSHEVINTIMMNYIAIFLADYLVGLNGPMRDPKSSVPQTPSVDASAQLPRLSELPVLMASPVTRGVTALVIAIALFFAVRWLWQRRAKRVSGRQSSLIVSLVTAGALGIAAYFVLGSLAALGGPFTDRADRLHLGFFLAVAVAVFIWWLLEKTTLGFEVRTVGASPEAAEYAGISIVRNFVLAMGISGALAGLAGGVEVLGLERNVKSFFFAGYGFDSIAVALLANNNPLGIIPSAFLFGALRNGADLMELRAGVSKQIISIVQALVLMFIAAPAIIRRLYRLRAARAEGVQLTRGWG